MMCEIMAARFVLSSWKAKPPATKFEIGVWSAWKDDKPENHLPLTDEEVGRAKAFLKSASPSQYYELFPDERPHSEP